MTSLAKISEVTLQDIKTANRIDFIEDDTYISNIIMPACKFYIKSYTGLTDEQIDVKEDLTIAYLVLCSDMYNNREYQVQSDKVNKVVESILNIHCVNFL